AEIITGALHKVEDHVEQLTQRLQRACRYRMMQARDGYMRLGVDTSLARLRESFARRQQRVDELRFRLEAAWNGVNRSLSEQLQLLTARLRRHDASHRLQLLRERLTTLEDRLIRFQQNQMHKDSIYLESIVRHLQILSPLAVLNRGY